MPEPIRRGDTVLYLGETWDVWDEAPSIEGSPAWYLCRWPNPHACIGIVAKATDLQPAHVQSELFQ